MLVATVWLLVAMVWLLVPVVWLFPCGDSTSPNVLQPNRTTLSSEPQNTENVGIMSQSTGSAANSTLETVAERVGFSDPSVVATAVAFTNALANAL